VGAFQTNGIFTHLLEESSTSYNGFCDIYVLDFNVFDWGNTLWLTRPPTVTSGSGSSGLLYPRYTEEQFLDVSEKVLSKLMEESTRYP